MKKNKNYLYASYILNTTGDSSFSDTYTCYVLNEVGQDFTNFRSIFCPDNEPMSYPYWTCDYTYDIQLARQLALLLMYQMGEK